MTGIGLAEAMGDGEIYGYVLLADARSMAEATAGGEITVDYVNLTRPDPEFEDETTRKSRVVTLAYPEECVIYRDSLSILTPLGTALLGLSNGQSMSYRDRDGSRKTIRMRMVLHQPEAGRAFRQSPRMR